MTRDKSAGARRSGPAGFFVSPLGIVFTTVLIDLIGFGIVLPILPLWAEDFGASAVVIGVITASYAVMQVLFAPLIGRISDRRGRRPVILLSLVGSIVAFLMIGFAQNLMTIFLARVLQGIAGASYGAAQAYVADVTTAKDRAHGMGMIGAAFGLGFLIGPAIGAGFGSIDARAPFFAAAALAAVNLLLAYRRLPESLRPGSQATVRPGFAALRHAFTARGLAPLMWLTFIANVAFIGMETTLALLGGRRFDYGMVAMALIFAYIGVLAVVSQGVLVRRLVPRLGEQRVLLLGLVTTAVGFALMAPAQQVWLFLVGLVPLALGSGLVFAASTALVSLSVDDREQGSILGVTVSVAAAARVIGPLVGGALFDHVDAAAPLVVGAVLFGLCALVARRMLAPTPLASPS